MGMVKIPRARRALLRTANEFLNVKRLSARYRHLPLRRIVRARDSQFLHFVLKGRALQSEPRSSSAWPGNHSSGLTQHPQNMFSLGGMQRAAALSFAEARLRSQFRQWRA